MAKLPIRRNAEDGINLDIDETRLSPKQARFIKNMTRKLNKGNSGHGYNEDVRTPQMGSVLLEGYNFPGGTNICCGVLECKSTNELYINVWNSGGNHFIYRIETATGLTRIVYKSPFLNYSLNPENFISEGRAALWVITDDNNPGKLRKGKYYVSTDDFNDQGFISVEDSIATNSFNATQFPYFAKGNCDGSQNIKLGVPTPMDCITVEEIARTEDDKYEQNLIVNKGWQFRVKHIDVFGRESEHGIISDTFNSIIGGLCIKTSEGLARCLKLTISAGCPLTDKIVVEYRNCRFVDDTSSVYGEWQEYDTIDKYNNNDANLKWYERSISNPYQEAIDAGVPEDIAKYYTKYNSTTHSFEYVFCNNRECKPTVAAETSRTENPLPLKSSGLTVLAKNILLSNNLRGFDPINNAELNKLSFTVTPPPEPPCDLESLRNITVYAFVFNPFHKRMSGVGKCTNNGQLTGRTGFGLANCNPGNKYADYGQQFPEGQEGFLGYLAGTNNYAISTQISYNGNGAFNDATYLLDYDWGKYAAGDGILYPGAIALQKFEFKNVKPGTYSFRISAHYATPNDDYQKLSTYVIGTTAFANAGRLDGAIKEMIVDCCEEDFHDHDNYLMIWDLTQTDGRVNDPCRGKGYIKSAYIWEDTKSRIPMDYVPVNNQTAVGLFLHSGFTDHNGFAFCAFNQTIQAPLYLTWNNCTAPVDINTDNHSIAHDLGYTKIYEIGVSEPGAFPAAARREISGRLKLCDSESVGVAGVLVVMKTGQFAFTDSSGNWKIISHSRYSNQYPDGYQTPNPTFNFTAGGLATQTLIVSQSGSCQVSVCDAPCNFCPPDYETPYVACGGGDRNITLAEREVAIRGINKKGLQSGGRYGIGIIAFDWMGRHSYVQGLEKHYVDIPSLTDTKQFSFPTLTWTLAANMRFPLWVKRFTFCITDNLKHDDFIMWAIDKVEYIDSSGNINDANPTKIRLYYASLNEYNKQNNFATTTTWQFIDANTNSVAGDVIQFIKNGDGSWFDKNISALARYDKEGRYIDIDYAIELNDLIEGAIVKIVRPKECINKDIYYELCSSYKVSNGVPQTLAGTLNVFDSYFLSRDIPIPVEVKNEKGEVVINITSKFYSNLFEHNSPSDFYGSHCANRGRVFFKNPYERQFRFKTEMAMSKAAVNKSAFNGLSYFDTADVVSYNEQEWGYIVVAIPELNYLLVICEADNFVVAYRDNELRVGDSGNIIAPSSDSSFGNPQKKIGQNYGCAKRDISSIRKRDGLVVFVDRSQAALVFHNYADAADMALKNGYRGHLMEKIRHQNNTMRISPGTQMYFVAGIDPKTGEYFLTNYQFVNQSGVVTPGSFINGLLTEDATAQETMIIDMPSGALNGFTSFTPEYYGSLESFNSNMVSFMNGKSWLHNSPDQVFNNFFGVQCKKVMRLVFNDMPDTLKRWLWIEVYAREHKMIAQAVHTETNQDSRIVKTYWQKRTDFYTAPFLCDLNTPADASKPIPAGAQIIDGNLLFGKWASVTLVSEDEDDSKYIEISGVAAVGLTVGKSAEG